MPILQWLTRETDVRAASKVPFRVLEEDASLGYGEEDTENMLIQGDNLDALKALLPYYAGQVKCIYIDPPYNTGHAFEHYDDNVEHSQWLSLMYPRLELLRRFLSTEGSLWVNCDDNEAHYLKVIMDELFGRNNFLADVSWQRTYSTRNDAKGVVTEVEHILAYGSKPDWMPNKLPRTAEMDAKYKNPDNDIMPWTSDNPFAADANTHQGMVYAIQHPFTGKMLYPSTGAHWRYSQEVMLEHMNGWCPYKLEDLHDAKQRANVCGIAEEEVRPGVLGIVLAEPLEVAAARAQAVYKRGQWPRFYFTKGGKGGIRRKTYLEKVGGRLATNFWPYAETGHTDEAKKEIIALFGSAIFATPKPERLIQRILHVATNPGDLVMDSFLGSGTTAAVAHKMGRQYIGIELGEHCITHCRPRLVKVVDGEQGGISKTVGWQGGGGFRFYRLGEPFFNEKGLISRDVSYKNLAAHIWFSETYKPMPQKEPTGAFLGVHGNTAYVVLHHDICGTDDLTSVVYRKLRREIDAEAPGVEKVVIYGESCRMGQEKLRMAGVIFKQIPYDVKGH